MLDLRKLKEEHAKKKKEEEEKKKPPPPTFTPSREQIEANKDAIFGEEAKPSKL